MTATPLAADGVASNAAVSAAEGAFHMALIDAAARARKLDRPVLASMSVSSAAEDAIDAFAGALAGNVSAALWTQPSAGLALVGSGEAWATESVGADRFGDVSAAWRGVIDEAVIGGDDAAAGPRLMGAFGFADTPATTSVWAGFERARFVLPERQLSLSPAGAWLTLNRMVSPADAEDIARPDRSSEGADGSFAAAVDDAAVVADDLPHLRIAASRPRIEAWQASVARMAGAVGRGRLDKAVLTRQVDLIADRPIDVTAVLRRLRESAPESTIFAVARGGRIFVGATPELLVRTRGRAFATVAMAGSTARGVDRASDAELARRLLESDKEREEHAIVVRMLQRTLDPIAAAMEVPTSPDVVRFRHVQHLATPIAGRLAEELGVIDLVERLHPTPAVGGTPTDLALELIADEERHERGWYAGPIGWVGADGDGEFAVALRSGVVAEDRATLLAGCGIVADSDPEREWQESLVKLQALGSALGHVAR